MSDVFFWGRGFDSVFHLKDFYINWWGERDLNKLEYRQLKKIVAKASKIEIAGRVKVSLRKHFYETFKKEYYKYPDKRDHSLIKYLCNGGFYKSHLFPVCAFCDGEKNSRTHVTNEC